jgi:hypothetical protein
MTWFNFESSGTGYGDIGRFLSCRAIRGGAAGCQILAKKLTLSRYFWPSLPPSMVDPLAGTSAYRNRWPVNQAFRVIKRYYCCFVSLE